MKTPSLDQKRRHHCRRFHKENYSTSSILPSRLRMRSCHAACSC
ncbi:Uncharacterised protein [Vibrio cholerae]|nr:Uncharacterised protein [Vibrio cholerae]